MIAPHAGLPRVSRRVALIGLTATGSVGVTGLTGCTTSSTSGPAGTATADPTAGSGLARGSVSPSPDAADDTALLARVTGELVALAGTVATAQRSAPALRRDLAPLLALHRTHAEALGEPLGRLRPARGGPARTQAQLARVRSGEERWQRRLVGYSVQAQSGTLARLLASMSAGTAQRLAVLPGARGSSG